MVGRQVLACAARRCRSAPAPACHVGLHADGHRHAAAVAFAQRLGHHHRVAEVQSGAAVFLGVLQAQQAQVAQLLEDLVAGELLGGLPLGDEGLISFSHERATVSAIWRCSGVNFMVSASSVESAQSRATPKVLGRSVRRLGLARDRQAQAEDAARVARVDDAVVPQPRGAEQRGRFGVEPLAQRVAHRGQRLVVGRQARRVRACCG